MEQDRVKTYVKGFDELIEGGIPKGHVVLVSGTPGAMKSSLAFYVLFNQAKRDGRKGLYLTLEQSRSSMVRQMARLGMDMDEVKDTLAVLDLGVINEGLGENSGPGSWLHIFKTYLGQLVAKEGFEFLAIDSLEVLETMSGIGNSRTDLFYLFEWMRELGITTLLISEILPDRILEGSYDEGYLSDGIIGLKMHLVREIEVQRRIRCLKMRETHHDTSYYSLLFNDGQFQIAKVISE